jgi:hypothetical protein
MLADVLGADLIRIARVLSPSAMISYALLMGGHLLGGPAIDVLYVEFFLTRGL